MVKVRVLSLQAAIHAYLIMGFPHPKHSISLALHCFSIRLVSHFNVVLSTQGALEEVLHKSPTAPSEMSKRAVLSQNELNSNGEGTLPKMPAVEATSLQHPQKIRDVSNVTSALVNGTLCCGQAVLSCCFLLIRI